MLGSNPTDPDPAFAPTVSVDASEFIFTFRLNPTAAADHPAVQYGSTLTGWTQAMNGVDGITVTTTPDGVSPGIDSVTVRIPRTLATGKRFFGRLSVEAGVSP